MHVYVHNTLPVTTSGRMYYQSNVLLFHDFLIIAVLYSLELFHSFSNSRQVCNGPGWSLACSTAALQDIPTVTVSSLWRTNTRARHVSRILYDATLPQIRPSVFTIHVFCLLSGLHRWPAPLYCVSGYRVCLVARNRINNTQSCLLTTKLQFTYLRSRRKPPHPRLESDHHLNHLPRQRTYVTSDRMGPKA